MAARGWGILALALALVASALPAGADAQGEAGQRVSFRVESAREVTNDRVVAVLAASAEDANAAAAAKSVNDAMSWALGRARRESAVEVKSGGYATHPVYQDGRIRRWRARQELQLESGEPAALTALVGELQSRLVLESFAFRVSVTERRRVEEELVREALAEFRARADLVRSSLEASAWVLDQVSIDTGGGRPEPVRFRAMAAEASPAPPAVEAGTSRLVVGVHGTIVLE